MRNHEKTYGITDTPANKNLIKKLEEKAYGILKIPMAEIRKITLSNEEIIKLKNIADFDWVIFADVFAVENFIESAEENGIDLFILDDLRVCALGEAVSDALRFRQIHSDVVPQNMKSAGVISSIRDYLADEKLEDQRILLVCESGSSVKFTAHEEIQKAKITLFHVYKAVFSGGADLPKIKVLIKSGAADEFIFSTARDVANFGYILGEDTMFEDLEVSAMDPESFQALRELGLKPRFFDG